MPLVFAMYSGTCNSIDFPNEDLVNWSVNGNSSNMDGFSYNKSGTNITYCLSPLFKSDNFTITFYNSQSVKVKEYEDSDYYGGGWYTYPWRTNQTSNETIINQTDINQTDINQTDLNTTTDIIGPETEEIGFWRRFWNWFKGLFGK